VNLHSHFRGRLPALSASLLFSITAELLKWQYPIYAANDAVFALAARLRVLLSPLFPQVARVFSD
jgi:hypothetical protein